MMSWLIFSSPGLAAEASCADACTDSINAMLAKEILAVALTRLSPKNM
jgi:hypothetical protein